MIVLGAGTSASALLRDLASSSQWRVVALLDDDARKHGGTIQGVKVAGGLERARDVAARAGAEQAIIAMPGATHAARKRAVDLSHHEWLPTLLAAAGEPDIAEKLKKGHQAGEKTFHVHIDGFNILPYLTGETDKYPRNFFFYVDDDGQLTAIRVVDWKIVYKEHRAKSTQLWAEPFVELRMPKIFNFRKPSIKAQQPLPQP